MTELLPGIGLDAPAGQLSGAGVCRAVARASGPVPGAAIISGAR